MLNLSIVRFSIKYRGAAVPPGHAMAEHVRETVCQGREVN